LDSVAFDQRFPIASFGSHSSVVLCPTARDQTDEMLYWLDIAKNILDGGISPEEARRILRLGKLQCETSEAANERFASSPAE